MQWIFYPILGVVELCRKTGDFCSTDLLDVSADSIKQAKSCPLLKSREQLCKQYTITKDTINHDHDREDFHIRQRLDDTQSDQVKPSKLCE